MSPPRTLGISFISKVQDEPLDASRKTGEKKREGGGEENIKPFLFKKIKKNAIWGFEEKEEGKGDAAIDGERAKTQSNRVLKGIASLVEVQQFLVLSGHMGARLN